LRALALWTSVTLQAPALPGAPAAAQQEAEKLADEVLAAPKGAVPFDVRAQALAVKGLPTRALIAYAEGLRPYLPPAYANGLLALVENHPALKRPESLSVPDPLEAERHYTAGLNFYTARDYPDAEKEFLAAVENDGQDARYFYFLGLARLAQGRRDAYEDFDQGAKLEQRNRPSRAAVSTALERVQGPPRRALNEARSRPR
jgi:tetratricopeptide (TPR) repeat protein